MLISLPLLHASPDCNLTGSPSGYGSEGTTNRCDGVYCDRDDQCKSGICYSNYSQTNQWQLPPSPLFGRCSSNRTCGSTTSHIKDKCPGVYCELHSECAT